MTGNISINNQNVIPLYYRPETKGVNRDQGIQIYYAPSS